MSFDRAFKEILVTEGGFVDDPLDRGGATNLGITEATARSVGYHGNMRDLPLETAKAIYRKLYWDKLKLDQVAEINGPIAMELFDSAVNVGPARAGKWLQQGLNVLISTGDLVVDGIIGNATLRALKVVERDGVSLFKILNILQGMHYIDICQRDPRQERFIRGWLSRVKL